jgi:pimeloyl-ACP methyl ester carboxylesterase
VPVVFISGLAANHRSWGFQFLDLKKYFQLIAIDNRGIGKSEGNFDSLTIEDMADDVGELFLMLNVERAHLIGSSMGGMIALEYAAKNPEKVCSLVLSSLPILENLGSFEAFTSELNLALAKGDSGNLFQTFASMYFSSNFLNDRRYEILTGLFDRDPVAYSLKTISLQIKAINEWRNLKNWAKGCTCACMTILGSEDKLLPVREAMDLISKTFPHAIKKVIQGAGHSAHIENPKEFNKIVYDFIQSQTC